MTRIFKHPQEIVADYFAAQHGAPLTVRLVRRYESQQREHPGSVLAQVMNAWLHTHPAWQKRLRLN